MGSNWNAVSFRGHGRRSRSIVLCYENAIRCASRDGPLMHALAQGDQVPCVIEV